MFGKSIVSVLAVCGLMVAQTLADPQWGPPYDPPYPPTPKCSNKWTYIGRELKEHFIDNRGLCTEFARQSIRMPFHDCFPGPGGCDGSIVLTDECTSRQENQQLIPMCGILSKISQAYDVGVADLINFAASIANKACPWGPLIPFYIGRQDNPTAALVNQLPPPTTNASSMIQIFAARGFTSEDLVALVGAHSAAYNLSRIPFDTTPGELDSCTYYKEVLTGDAPTVLFSDRSLATHPDTQDDWIEYGQSQESWDEDYVKAMTKMILLGTDISNVTDCTRIVHRVFYDHYAEGSEDPDAANQVEFEDDE